VVRDGMGTYAAAHVVAEIVVAAVLTQRRVLKDQRDGGNGDGSGASLE
jgi:hypothetical protein